MRWWHSDPSGWPPWVLLGLAAAAVLPPPVLLAVGAAVAAVLWALAGVGVWLWLGSRTPPGFPFLFDALALQVFLWSAATILLVVLKWVRS